MIFFHLEFDCTGMFDFKDMGPLEPYSHETELHRANTIADMLIEIAQGLRNDGVKPSSTQWVRDNSGERIGICKFETR